MEASKHRRHSASQRVHRVRTPAAYRICDGVTEGALYFQAVFAPWAFGTTEPWSVWTMNASAYALGALVVAKWFICWRAGYRPMRWGEAAEVRSRKSEVGMEGALEERPNTEHET